MGVRGFHIVLLSLALGLAWASPADAEGGFKTSMAQVDEQKARDTLSNKLMKLSQSLDMHEISYSDSATGGKDTNNNDGNSFTSNTTYHSYVWSYCMRYAGPRNCTRWLDPYVSPHGAQADHSPLEKVVYDEWNKVARDVNPTNPNAGVPQGANVQYGIWDIKRDPNAGPLLDRYGRLDRTGITDMRLKADVRRKVEEVGRNTAQRQINLTMEGEEQGTMPNMEALRMMAGRWTKMMRNRLMANLGELRVADAPIEFGLGEDYATCMDYVQRGLQEEADPSGEARRKAQGQLDFATRQIQNPQDRASLCQQLFQVPYFAVNPQVGVDNQTIQEGDPNIEQVDKWRSRLNIAAIDSIGRDPNEVNHPGNVEITREEQESELSDYEAGGLSKKTVRRTNAEQVAGYNRNLEDAAVGMREVAARTGGADDSAEALKYKIALRTQNLVEINGLTPEMRGELGTTKFSQTASGAIDVAKRPETKLEITPSELTVRRLQ